MLFSVLLLIVTAALHVEGQDCTSSNLLIDPGNEGIDAVEAGNASYPVGFSMLSFILNNSGETLYIALNQNMKTCFSLRGVPDCTNDLRVIPNPTGVPDERGRILYRSTPNQSELSSLADYVYPGFIARHAVIITYFCYGEMGGYTSDTVQVIVTTGEDVGGVKKTILLTTIGQKSNNSAPDYFIIASANYSCMYSIFEKETKSFDITYRIDSPVVGMQGICSPTTILCEITLDGHLTKFDGGEEDLVMGNRTLAEWNPGNIDCKFKFIAKMNNRHNVVWVGFAVGPHKRQSKFFRLVDFNQLPGYIKQRGWKCKAGCKHVISSFDHDIENENGTVYATVREIDPGNTYVIDSQLCSGVNDPNYKMTFHFNAKPNETMASLELSHQFYVDNQDQLTGHCFT